MGDNLRSRIAAYEISTLNILTNIHSGDNARLYAALHAICVFGGTGEARGVREAVAE